MVVVGKGREQKGRRANGKMRGKSQTGESRHLVGELSSYRTRVTRNLSVATRGFHIPHTAGLRSSLENMLKFQEC